MHIDADKVKHMAPGLVGGIYKPLGPNDEKQMAEASFELLERGGTKVFSKTAFEAFRKAGAKCDDANQTVYISRSLMEDCIESNPSSITLYSRDGENDCVLEDSKVHYGTGGTAIYVLDPDTGERVPSTTEDVILNARMVEKLDHVHLFTINVFPNEVAHEDIDVNRFFHALNNTKKHVMGGFYTIDGLKKAIDIAETIAGGADKLRAKPFVSFITLVISPFKIDNHYGEATCYLAENNLPVVVPTEPMCGTTAPVTLAANILTHTAETLAGIALVQCVKKGAPGICGSVGSISDLKTMGNLAGCVERGIINAAVAQMSQYFKIPMYATAGTSDAKEVDIQAAYESAMSALLVAMSGANYIHDIAGLMEFDLTVSYDKLVMDNEILGMCQRVLRGVEVNPDTLATELMIEKGPAQDYIAEMHTVEYMRNEFYDPVVSNREKREQMGPDTDAASTIKKFIDGVRKSEQEDLIDSSLRQSILDKYPSIKRTQSR